MLLRATLIAIALLGGCRSRAPEPKPMTSPPPSAPVASPLDSLFREYEKKLPEPATLSEQNGASLECAHHGSVTYTLLAATARTLPIASDAELLRLAAWARSADVCVRQIALEALVTRIGFDVNRVSLPGMHEPEDHHFHDIFVALAAYLRAAKVPIPTGLFAQMYLDVSPADFAMLKGVFREDAVPGKNFVVSVHYDGELLRVTRHRVEPDPAWPDHTNTTKVKSVAVNARKQFVVTGEWDVESNAKGYQGPKNSPSGFAYAFWPVAADIVWFDEGNGQWTKLRRAQ